MLKPWTIASTRTVIKGDWIDLSEQRVVTGRGDVLDPYYILAYPDWSVAVAITADDEVVMVRQYRHGTGVIGLELPGGVVDAGETGEQAAIRELAEETGYGGGKATYVGRLAANPALQTNYLHVTLIEGVEPVGTSVSEIGEELVVERVPLAALVALAASGGIEQSLHVAALMLALAQTGRLVLAGTRAAPVADGRAGPR